MTMNSPSHSPSAIQDGLQWELPTVQLPSYFPVICIMLVVVVYRFASSDKTVKALPSINTRGLFSSTVARKTFTASAESFLNEAKEKHPRKPWRVMTDLGERVVLTPELMEEIRNEPNMSFQGAFHEDFHGSLPGFDAIQFFVRSDILIAVVRNNLLRPTLSMTERMSDETNYALSKTVGNTSDWTELNLCQTLTDMVSRVSARLFVGEELCRNEEWIQSSQHFHHTWFAGAMKLHDWPWPLRHLVHWFIPECQEMKKYLGKQKKILADFVAKRENMKKDAAAAGQEAPKFDDGFTWLEQEAKARGLVYDTTMATGLQLMIALVSAHATTDLLQKTMFHLLQHPGATEQIREEVLGQLRTEGMTTASFYNMHLLDSALKESQRVTPSEMLLIRRRVMGDVQLSNGLFLKEGTRTWMDVSHMKDPAIYENPEQWDMTRFAKLRTQPGGASSAQLVSSTRNHVGFGYGKHVCTGRFFATNLLKVVLCHLLANYEWKLAPGLEADFLDFGISRMVNPQAKLLIRRREKVEIDFDSIFDS
ncbi:cytochrome P450 [Annulohypoxylon maeteangense]|uniref:cytochrome P450 n=1 Tax=Annulohypoxylon maeteangense TaxID=1927788 RepID=UPI002007C9D9|nr:cytochrome P450 [Annulohypoxylon maeteangense]KAI0889645.1 cytochrome P450 [Annulohypoxylon maeteangense]